MTTSELAQIGDALAPIQVVGERWAFGDVLAKTTLEARTRLTVQLAPLIACHATAGGTV